MYTRTQTYIPIYIRHTHTHTHTFLKLTPIPLWTHLHSCAWHPCTLIRIMRGPGTFYSNKNQGALPLRRHLVWPPLTCAGSLCIVPDDSRASAFSLPLWAPLLAEAWKLGTGIHPPCKDCEGRGRRQGTSPPITGPTHPLPWMPARFSCPISSPKLPCSRLTLPVTKTSTKDLTRGRSY